MPGRDAVWLASATAEGLMARSHVIGLPSAIAPSLAMSMATIAQAPLEGASAQLAICPTASSFSRKTYHQKGDHLPECMLVVAMRADWPGRYGRIV